MAYLTHSIGGIAFVNATGEPGSVRNRVERLLWPGVNSARYRNIGVGSEPFQLETYTDVASITAGRTTFATYEALVGAGVQAFTLKGHSFAPYGVAVLDVKQRSLTSVLHIAGRAVSGSNTAQLRATWTLELKTI